MSTILGVMGVPITGGPVRVSFTGRICIQGCIRSDDQKVTFTFYAPIFSGTFDYAYHPKVRRGYWGW